MSSFIKLLHRKKELGFPPLPPPSLCAHHTTRLLKTTLFQGCAVIPLLPVRADTAPSAPSPCLRENMEMETEDRPILGENRSCKNHHNLWAAFYEKDAEGLASTGVLCTCLSRYKDVGGAGCCPLFYFRPDLHVMHVFGLSRILNKVM